VFLDWIRVQDNLQSPTGAKTMSEVTDNEDGYVGTLALNRNELLLPKYNKYVVQLITNFWFKHRHPITATSYKILDFGAGLGTLSTEFENRNNVKVDCFEIDNSLIEILKQKKLNTYSQIKEIENLYDLVYSSNVLEHIEEDIEAIKSMKKMLKPNGLLILFVPAFNSLFSRIDSELGHYRRYTIPELKRKLHEEGFETPDARYCDSIGFLAWYAAKVLRVNQKMTKRVSISLKIFDKIVLPVSKKIDKAFPNIFFGKNLLIIGIKKEYENK